MSALSTIPASIELASTETLPIEVSFAVWLGAATITASVASLVDIETGVARATSLGAKSATTTTVTQTLLSLESGHRYRLIVTITDTSLRVWSSETAVICVF